MAMEHTAKAFDEDLQELARLVAEMGGLVERQIVDSVDALIRRDINLSARVVSTDVELDKLQHMIEERGVLTIARRQPMAVDLREIVGALRVATDPRHRLEELGRAVAEVAQPRALHRCGLHRQAALGRRRGERCRLGTCRAGIVSRSAGPAAADQGCG